jgi:excisionase family DNA binding protein
MSRPEPPRSVGDLPLMLTVEEAARVARCGRGAAYAAVHRGDIPSVRIGRTIRVPRDRLIAVLERRE